MNLAENIEERKYRVDELLNNRFTDSKRSTKEERKQYRLDKKQQQKDREVGCECEGERIRVAEYCDTYRLIVKVDEYMINLFRNAAQGRTSSL
jgi:hypothetical protein